MKIHCRNCTTSVRYPSAITWEKYGLCPVCADKRKYPEYDRDDLMKDDALSHISQQKKINDVDLYWDTLTTKAVQLGLFS